MWLAGTVSLGITASGASLLAASPARADDSPGTGNAYAQLLQDTPREGSLMVGVIAGEALAGHTDTVARAQSQGLDETAIGTSLQAYNCGTAPSAEQKALVAQPLQAETGEPGADQGYTDSPTTGASSIGPTSLPPSFGSTEFAQATGTPYGLARTSYDSLAVPGAPFSANGLTSQAFSGLVNGQREAGASAEIGSLDLAGTAVQLDGLKWSVVYPSGGNAPPTGSFSVGGLLIGGKAVSFPSPDAAVGLANTALSNLGIVVTAPTIQVQQGIEMVTPLEVEVVPNSTRDAILDGVVNQTGPVTQPVLGGLENGFSPAEPAPVVQALCQSDTPITVLDIAIASVDGGGSYVTSFGGVNATSGAIPTNPYNLNLPGGGLGSGSTQYFPGSAGTAGTTGSPAIAGTAGGASGSSATAGSAGANASSAAGNPTGSSHPAASAQPVEDIAAAGTSPGGPLLAIGLGGLAGLLLLAEGDRRVMKRAQRAQIFE